MKTWTEKELLSLLSKVRLMEKGRGVSDADNAYKRGWRFALRYVANEIKEARDK